MIVSIAKCCPSEADLSPAFSINRDNCPGTIRNFDLYNVAVVVIDEEVILSGYADLPDEGLFDIRPMHAAVTLVRYACRTLPSAAVHQLPLFAMTGALPRLNKTMQVRRDPSALQPNMLGQTPDDSIDSVSHDISDSDCIAPLHRMSDGINVI